MIGNSNQNSHDNKINYLLFLSVMALSGCVYNPMPQLQQNQIRVQATDTLEVIADKYDVTVKELLEYNGIKYPYQIFVGQVLRIPEINDEQEIEEEEKSSGALIGKNAVKKIESFNAQNVKAIKPNTTDDEDDSQEDNKNPVVNSSFANALKKKIEQNRIEQNVEDDKTDSSDDNDIEPVNASAMPEVKPKNTQVKSEMGKSEMVKSESSNEIDQKEDDDIEPETSKKPESKTETKKAETKKVLEIDEKEILSRNSRKSEFMSPLSDFENVSVNKKSKTLRLKPKKDFNIYAVEDGEVFVSDKSYPAMGGRMVVIKHKIDGKVYLSVYGGMADIDPQIMNKTKKFISKGEILGNLGMTRDKKHILNFELRKENQQIAPESMIKALAKNEKSAEQMSLSKQVSASKKNPGNQGVRKSPNKPKK